MLIGLVIVISTGILAAPVSAHILADDGNIGAILHIDPDDDPIAGQQAGFFFEFKDKQNKFDPTHCDCTFQITENSKTISSQPLFANSQTPSLDNASVFFTFPERNVYLVQVVGKPYTAGEFKPFTLTWNIRVDRGTDQTEAASTTSNNTSSTSQSETVLGLTGFVIVVGGLVAYFFSRRVKQKRRKKPSDEIKDKDIDKVY